MTRTSALTHRQVGTLFDGSFTEFFAVLRDASGSVATAEFYETRPDLGEAAHLKTASWQLPVPAAATLSFAGSARLPGSLKNFWVSWQEGQDLHVASLGQEKPGLIALGPKERPILPALMYPGDVLLQLSHDEASQRMRLHRAHASVKATKMDITTTDLGPMAPPLLAAVAPVPGEKKEIAYAFSIEVDPAEGPQAVLRVIEGDKIAREARSEPFPSFTPLPGQRLATMVGKEGRSAMAFVARRDADGALVLALIAFAPNEPKTGVGMTELPALQQGSISAQVDFYRRVDEIDFLVFTVAANGLLIAAARDLEDARAIAQVDPSYTYPIAMATGSAYELDAGGTRKPRITNLLSP